MEQKVIEQALAVAKGYSQYREMVNRLYASGRATGDTQSEAYLEYTGLNIHRMEKWDKHFSLSEEVKALLRKMEEQETWLVISEGWCGDAAHNLPVIHKLAEASPKIDLKIVLRDENPELMDRFLTNGGRSIPKLIRLSGDGKRLKGTWGPRPKEAQELMLEMKAAEKPLEETKEALQLWYGRDRGKSIETELAAMLALG